VLRHRPGDINLLVVPHVALAVDTARNVREAGVGAFVRVGDAGIDLDADGKERQMPDDGSAFVLVSTPESALVMAALRQNARCSFLFSFHLHAAHGPINMMTHLNSAACYRDVVAAADVAVEVGRGFSQ